MTTKELNKKKKEPINQESDVKKDLQEMKITIAIIQKQLEDLAGKLNIDTRPNLGYTKEDFDELASFYHKK
jgi:hypothetical protein